MLDTKDLVFERIQVNFLVRGMATITWSLYRHFVDSGPYAFQLQAGATGIPAATDWIDIGPPVTDIYLATDPVRRATGRDPVTHYRVILATANGVYTSRPAHVYGILDPHDWVRGREIVRQTRLRHRYSATPGWLLKRIYSGQLPDPMKPLASSVDPVSGTLIRTKVATAGTEFRDGYYAAYPFSADMAATGHNAKLDDNRGTSDDAGLLVPGLVVQIPEVSSGDVFVAKSSDRRYYLHDVRNIAEWRGVPLVARCACRLAAAGDIIYGVTVPAIS